MIFTPSIPIIASVMIVTYLVLVGSISWVAWNRHDDGIRGLALALCSSTLGYIILSGYGKYPDYVSIGGFYILSCLNYVFLQYGLMKFLRYRMPWLLFLSPVVIILISLPLTHGDIVLQTKICDLIFICQDAVICAIILRTKLNYPSCGCNMFLAGIAMSALITMWWLVMLFRIPDILYGSTHSMTYQLQLYFASYVLTLLISNGFILMTKERLEAELQANLRHDDLTGLNKSRWIEEAARSNLARLQNFALPVTMLLIDIDHFKETNSRYGYVSGNRILQQLSDLLQNEITCTNEIYRMKGGSFAVLIPALNIYQVMDMTDRLMARITGHSFDEGSRITVSCGISVACTFDSWTSWLFRAQHALQKAKAYGNNQVCVEELEFSTRNLPNDVTRVGELHWHPSYSTGQAEIDTQHRELFERTNALLHLWVRTDDKLTITAAVGGLLDLAKAHLDFESKQLAKISGEGMEQIIRHHDDSHKKMLQRAEDLFARYQQNELTNDALFTFIVFEFVIGHISAEDNEIAPILRTVA